MMQKIRGLQHTEQLQDVTQSCSWHHESSMHDNNITVAQTVAFVMRMLQLGIIHKVKYLFYKLGLNG